MKKIKRADDVISDNDDCISNEQNKMHAIVQYSDISVHKGLLPAL